MTTKPETNYFDEGKNAAVAYYASPHLAGFTRNVKAKDAIKLFWPTLPVEDIQMEQPLPKPRQKWLAGFRKGQAEILAVNNSEVK